MTDTLESTGIVEDRLRGIVATLLHMESRPEAITPGSNLFELGLESLTVIELLTEIETAFDVTVDVEDLSDDVFVDFAGLVRFVEALVARG